MLENDNLIAGRAACCAAAILCFAGAAGCVLTGFDDDTCDPEFVDCNGNDVHCDPADADCRRVPISGSVHVVDQGLLSNFADSFSVAAACLVSPDDRFHSVDVDVGVVNSLHAELSMHCSLRPEDGIVEVDVDGVLHKSKVFDDVTFSDFAFAEVTPSAGAAIDIFVGDSSEDFASFQLFVGEPRCGNGLLDPGEVCDDGNLTDGDGCDASCNRDCAPDEIRVNASPADLPVQIVDNQTVTSLASVEAVGTVRSVQVVIDELAHSFMADLDVFLVSPSLTRVELSTGNGGSGGGYFDTVFDDACFEVGGPIEDGADPFSGCFAPEGRLADVVDEPVGGTWTLEVSDTFEADSGVLSGWSLALCIAP